MRVGVPREIKSHEYRVGLTPASVHELIAHGHEVVVERQAGEGIGAADEEYRAVGAAVLDSAAEVFASADMIVKVKEPQAAERAMLRPGQVLFTYLHLAPDPEQARDLVASGAICIAYETVMQPGGGLPLLAPMSEVAGRMAVQAGAHCLERAQGGSGVLLGGVPGVPPARIVILGAGVVGSNATQIAVGTGAQVVVLDRNLDTLRRIDRQFGARVITAFASRDQIERQALQADLLIGAVLVPGAAAPKLIRRELVARMPRGSVIVDVAIDQGGCVETAHPTTHADPTYVVDGVVHYCVANMPGAVPRTSAHALNHATLPFALRLADRGWRQALRDDEYLRAGLNVAGGQVMHAEVAQALGYPLGSMQALLGS